MTRNEKNKILMVGPFPPPVHGLLTTNAELHGNLVASGAEASVLNTSAPSLDRSLSQRLDRLPVIMRGLRQLATMPVPPKPAFYLSASGGWGQSYDVLYLLLARMRKMRVFIRHCSFAYLDAPTLLARLVVALAGKQAVHVTQSKGMAERLQALYGAGHVIPISNAVLYPKELDAGRERTALTTLGFLSNLSAEKGVFDFLDMMAAAKEAGLPVTGFLAGACQDQETRELIEERLPSLPNVGYLGAAYDAEKERCFESIDVLVFRARYLNEIEAKVNHEAMSIGIPVIAYGRGCISEIVGVDCWLVIDPAALDKHESWLGDPVAFAAASRAIAARFVHTYDESKARWRALLADLTGVARARETVSVAGGGKK